MIALRAEEREGRPTLAGAGAAGISKAGAIGTEGSLAFATGSNEAATQPGRAAASEDRRAVAFHEAGHAWGYASAGLALRYVTIRPREAGTTGACRIWRPRRIDHGASALIAALGPIAEAMHTFAIDPDDHLDFVDHLTVAVLCGGAHDLALTLGMLDSTESVDRLRVLLREAWDCIETLAEELLEHGTVPGVAVRDIVGAHPVGGVV